MVRSDRHLQLRVLAMLMGVLLSVLIVCYINDYKDADSIMSHINGEAIIFSEETGFYNDSVFLNLKASFEAPLGVKIYYTLDGNDPNESSFVYSEPVLLEAKSDTVTVYPVKACLYYRGVFSAVVEHTYVVGEQVSERFELNVISVTIDSDCLNNPVNGIFLNPEKRGDEWTRDAHIAMFESNGNVLLEQDIGLNVAGGTSSRMDVKSFKITADPIYDDEAPKFEFDCYYDEELTSNWSFVKEYNSLKLKSGAQDMFQGNIRSAVVSRLAKESAFEGCTDTERAVLYFNGKFYGIFDIQQQYSNSFLANKFNLDITDAIEKHEGSEMACFMAAGLTDCFKTNLDLEENRIKLEQSVDMKSFFLYYAIEILSGNTDWPQNNYQIWRYTGESDITNPYSDGRWRFLIYDTDATYYSVNNTLWFEGIELDNFVSLLEGEYRATDSVFANVMQSKIYRDQFVTIMCDLLNTSFKTENVLQIIDEEFSKISEENYIQYGEVFADDITSNYIVWMCQQAEERDEEVRNIFNKYFELESTYDFSFTTTEGIRASWGNTDLFGKENYTNSYYNDVEFTITQQAYPGYNFLYWLVNGEKVEQEALTITQEWVSEGSLSITAVAERNVDEMLVISEISGKSEADWIKLCNVGEKVIDLSQYYITDNEKQLMQYQLPSVLLQAGETIILNGDTNYYAIGDYICNFSLNKFETVSLYNSITKQIVDAVSVPRMEDDETYGRYLYSNHFVFFRNVDGKRNISTY